jgi:hypothetical protein
MCGYVRATLVGGFWMLYELGRRLATGERLRLPISVRLGCAWIASGSPFSVARDVPG